MKTNNRPSLADWLISRRRWLLCVGTLLAVIAGIRTVQTYAHLRSDLEELLPESAPSVRALKAARARLPGLRHLGVVMLADTPEKVTAVRKLADDLAARANNYARDLVEAVRQNSDRESQFIERHALTLMDPEDVATLRKAVEARRDFIVSEELDLGLDDAVGQPPPIPWKEIQEKYEKRHGITEAKQHSRFESEDGRVQVVVLQTASNATSYDADRRLIDRVNQDLAAHGITKHKGNGITVGFAGDVAARVEEMDGLVVDLGISSVLVSLLVAGSIVWFYRSIGSLVVLGIPLLFGTLYTFALVALPPLRIVSLNTNTAFLGSIVVGNGINSAIILLARYHEERARGADRRQAMSIAVSQTWRPTLAASAAAAVAYGSLIITEFRGFNQFGWIGGVGMMVCWLANYVFVPAMVGVLDPSTPMARRASAANGKRGAGSRLAAWLVERPRPVLGVTLAAVVACAAGLYMRQSSAIEYDLSKLRRRDTCDAGECHFGKYMDRALGQYLTPSVILAESAVDARVIAQRLRALQSTHGAGGLIGNVRTADDILPIRHSESLAEARKLAATITPRMLEDLDPQQRERVQNAISTDALTELTPDDVPKVLLTGLREIDGRSDRNVIIFPKLGGNTWNADRIGEFSRDVRAAAIVDGRAAPVASSLCLSSDIARAMMSDGPKATLVSLSVVLLICWLAFRSTRLSALTMASLAVGVTFMLGTLAWSGAKLNFSNFVTLPITFGIAADYAINILRRYQSEGGSDARRAVLGSGGAVALCSATTVIGFGSLLVAQNRALFSFGVFAVTGELTCLSTAVILLPAFLYLRERGRKTETVRL